MHVLVDGRRGVYEPLSLSGDELVRQLDNGSLLVSEASEREDGYYLCQASNGVGLDLSKVIQLTVNGQYSTLVYNVMTFLLYILTSMSCNWRHCWSPEDP